jgi:hypothetical protein
MTVGMVVNKMRSKKVRSVLASNSNKMTKIIVLVNTRITADKHREAKA